MLRDPSLVPLSRQHHNGLALVVLSERSLAEDGSPENVARLAKRAVERFEVELVNHFGMEEDVLLDEVGGVLEAKAVQICLNPWGTP